MRRSVSSTGESQPPQASPPRSWRDRLAVFLARRSEFSVNIAKLASGTAVRTLISFGTIPIVTRLYSPGDFGDLQLLLAIVGPFVVISTLMYDTALVLPEERRDSDRIAVLCLSVVFLLTLLLSALTLTFGDWFFALFDAERLVPFAGLVVLGFLVGGVLRTTNYMLVAKKQFGGLAKNNVLQVSTTQSTNPAGHRRVHAPAPRPRGAFLLLHLPAPLPGQS